MFKETFNLGLERKGFKEAFGFYIIHLLVAIAGALILGVLVINNVGQEVGPIISTRFAIMYCAGLSFFILKKKSLLKNIKWVFIALLGLVVAYFSGALGLMVSAYFSTLPPSTNSNITPNVQ